MSEQEKKWTLDAVAALSNAIADSKHIMKSSPIAGLDVFEMLIAQGYTIRRETMTGAELEREALQLAVDIWECGAERDRKNDTDKCKQWIIEIAKKYRG